MFLKEAFIYIIIFIFILGIFILLGIIIYYSFFNINKKQKYIKITIIPNENSIKSKGYVFKFNSFIMNAYTMPEDGVKNNLVLEIDGGDVYNRFSIYVPYEYGEDYIRIIRSHYPDAVLEYDFNKLYNNQIEKGYNYSYFRHSSMYPLGKKIEELDILQNISAIINSIQSGEKLQMILNFEGVLDDFSKRKDIAEEIEQIRISNIGGNTNIYKKIFATIRFLSKTKTPKIMSIGGLMGYIFEKNGSMRYSRIKIGNKITEYPLNWKEKLQNFLFNLQARGNIFLQKFSRADGFYLNETEIAGLFNFVPGSKLETVSYKKLNPKNAYQKVKIEQEKNIIGTKIGAFDYPGYEDKNFILSDISKRKHIYCIGKTGMGKSTILSQLMKDDIEKGKGFALFDPNGDLAKDIMGFIPETRKDDVVYICPSSPIGNISLGIFDFLRAIRDANLDEAQKKIEETGSGILTNNLDVIASNLVSVIRSVSIGGSEMWGPRMDMLLRAGIKAVLGSSDKATIADLITFYNDLEFRKAILRRIKNPYERAMWEKIESMDPKEVELWYQPIRNRLINYSTEVFLGLFSTPPKFDLNKYINSNKILIFDLAKGPTGTDIGRFTGTVMFALIWEFIQLRAKIPKNERKDFSVYIDEFQNYVTETFTSVLSEARKYALSLVIAHQYLDQIKESDVLPAVLGNCGTVISLQIGIEDGKKLSNFFGIDAQDLASIPPYKAYVKSNDYSTEAFNISTFPIEKEKNIKYVNAEELMLYSYSKYGTTKEDLEKNTGLYGYFIKNKRLPNDIMNEKENLDFNLLNSKGFDLNNCGTDVEINDKNKLISYQIKEEDVGKTWLEISQYMGFSDYTLFEENIQTFNVSLKKQTNKVQKNFIGKTLVVYYGGIVK